MKKFIKAFITSGVGSVVVALSVGVSVHTLTELKNLLALIGTAFVVGGFHAVWNAYFAPQPTV